MALEWSDPVESDFWDAYLDFSQEIEARRAALRRATEAAPAPAPDWFDPIFVRLVPNTADPRAPRRALRDLVRDADSPLVMDGHELAALEARLGATDPDAGLPDEYALYMRQGTDATDFGAVFDLLDKGVRVDLGQPGAPEAADAPEAPAPWAAGQPIVALIDDGIGFLNARFRRTHAGSGAHSTRFHGLWLQATERRQGGGPGSVQIGTVLTRSEIDAFLADPARIDEATLYGRLNDRLYGPRAHRSTDLSVAHGTHVLDLAAGADPADTGNPARDWPLLGVQLPPEAVADTSGTRFESYLVQGLRWILRQARAIDPTAPVIANISMGILSGPKDGTRFAEYQIAREARLWEQATGQPVRVVWSFGNSYRTRQVAVFDFEGGAAAQNQKVTWRIQPDDLTPSFLEIRSDRPLAPEALNVSLCPPHGTPSGFAALEPGHHLSLTDAGAGPEAAVARLYAVPPHRLDDSAQTAGFLALCLGPTGNEEAGEPLAPAGAWTVTIRHSGPDPVRVTAQIQRGDSLPGYRPRGRQSYFDAASAFAWDPETADSGGLAPGCPITRAGSHSALVTAPARQVLSVGAAEWVPATARFRPALYSAEGSDWGAAQPSMATLTDDSRVFAGVLAAGTYTGSVTALNGTSAAAGRLSRALALCADRVRANAAAGGGAATDDIDPAILVPQPVDASDASRLGAFVVTGQGGARDRRGETEHPPHVPPAAAIA